MNSDITDRLPSLIDPSIAKSLPPLGQDWQQWLQSFFVAASSVAMGMCILDENLRYVQINEALAESNGQPVADHLGRSIGDVMPELATLLEPLLRQVLAMGEAIENYQLVETTANAEQRHWIGSFVPLQMASQRGVGAILLEVTARKQNETALHQQIERERLINRIALRIRQSLDLPAILNTAVVEVQQFLAADRVIIERYDANYSSHVVAEAVSDPWQPILGERLPQSWDESQLADFRQGQTVVVEEMQALPQGCPLAIGRQVRAQLVMPIWLGNTLWGILAAHQCNSSRRWEAFEIELLERLATQLAIAIQQSELHQEIQHLNDHLEAEVEARTAQLQLAFDFEATLKRITDRVRDSLDVDLILQAVVRELAIVMGVRGCNASLYDTEQGTSTTCYEYTNSLSPYQGRVSKFLAAQELYHQLLQGQYFQFCSLVPNPERGLSAMLACPILDDQGVIGDLWLIHHKDYAFNEQDIRIVQQVANQCAIAIRQARLYEASQAQVRELERLNQLKDDFLSTVSHELRTPLSNIKMAIHMLRTAPTSDRRSRYLEILDAECRRETDLINDLLDLQRLENDSYSTSLEPILLQDWLPKLLKPFLSRAQNRQQQLTVNIPPDLPPLLSDARSLERILAEILNNACKYTPPECSIRLVVDRLPDPESPDPGLPDRSLIQFTVSNQAKIDPNEVPRMFEKFYRIPKSDPWQQGGTGLGLALVKKLVENIGGSIEADSSEGWTTLRVQVPGL